MSAPLADSRRPRRSWRGYAIRGLSVCAVVLTSILVVVVGRGWFEDFKPARANAFRAAPIVRSPDIKPPRLNAVLEQIAHTVVVIEADGPDGRRPIGAGIVVDDAGHILTCLHVSVRMASGAVRFSNGTEYDIAGCVAVDPQRDLVLLELKQLAADMGPFRPPTTALPERSPIWAVGHPLNRQFAIVTGQLQRRLMTDELPDASRRFLEQLTPGEEPRRWMQHSARLEDGFSGGPLFNAAGEVLGLNLWVDDEQQVGYALDFAELQAFLAAPREKVIPLERLALPEVRERNERWQISGDRLLRLLDHARALQWQPASYDDYQILRSLASGLTLARQPELLEAEGGIERHLEKLARAADKVVAELRRKKWRDAGQLVLLNEFASQALAEPSGGLFAFAQVQDVQRREGRPPIVDFRLSGFDQRFRISFADQLEAPEVGSQFLILGLIQPTSADDPTTQQPLVVCHEFIPLEKP